MKKATLQDLKERKQKLTMIEYDAFKFLSSLGLFEVVILNNIIPSLPKGELDGYQDVYVKRCHKHFIRNTKQKGEKEKAGAFVNWFTIYNIYSEDILGVENEVLIKIREDLIREIKKGHSENADWIGIRMKKKNILMKELKGKELFIDFNA